MAAILGIRDTLSTEADRLKNWRRTVLVTFPNGGAPLTAVLAMTDPEPTDDSEFKWYEFPLPTQRSTVDAAAAIDATEITVADQIFRASHIIRNNTTGEVAKVTSVTNIAGGKCKLTLLRNKATTVTVSGTDYQVGKAVAMAKGQGIQVIGTANPEGAALGQVLSYDPTAYSNQCQIWREPFGVTGSAMGTPLIYDKRGKYARDAINALNFHCMQMERSFIWGALAKFQDPNTGKVERWTMGIYSFISTYAPSNIINMDNAATLFTGGVANTLTYPIWETIMEQAFRVCLDNTSREKLVLCGSGFATMFNQVCMNKGSLHVVPKEETFGLVIKEHVHANGRVLLHTHPLFTGDPDFRYAALILDFKGLKYVPKEDRDTKKLVNRQNNGDDQRIDEFLTEAGLELHHAPAHMIVTNATKIA